MTNESPDSLFFFLSSRKTLSSPASAVRVRNGQFVAGGDRYRFAPLCTLRQRKVGTVLFLIYHYMDLQFLAKSEQSDVHC